MSDEYINYITTSSYSITPESSYFGTKKRVKFHENCLKQDKIIFTHGKTANIYILYETGKNFNISSYPIL